MVFPGTGVDYDANLDEVLDIPFVGTWGTEVGEVHQAVAAGSRAQLPAAAQAPRNTDMVRILRDYGRMDDCGMGIRRKMMLLMMEHNGAPPDFEATEDGFKVTLWKGPRSRAAGEAA